jgi:hypothetical protein
MERTIRDPATAKLLDVEFFFIFQSALGELRPLSKVSDDIHSLQKLSLHLEELAARIQEKTGVSFGLKDVSVPLCRPPIRPQRMIDADTPPNVAIGMHLIDSVGDCVRMKGDGHCLFRAVSAGLHWKYKDSIPALREKLIVIRQGVGRNIESDYWDRILKSLDQCIPSVTVFQLMNEPQFSDLWMIFMRKLAEAGLKEKLRVEPSWKDVFTASLPEVFKASPESYIEAIGNPSTREFGGEAEIIILSSILDPIHLLDAQAIGIQGDLTGHDFVREKESIQLLLRPGHFDLCILRPIHDTLRLDQVD